MTFKANPKDDAEEGKLGLDTFMGPTYSEMSGVTYDSKLKLRKVVIVANNIIIKKKLLEIENIM